MGSKKIKYWRLHEYGNFEKKTMHMKWNWERWNMNEKWMICENFCHIDWSKVLGEVWPMN